VKGKLLLPLIGAVIGGMVGIGVWLGVGVRSGLADASRALRAASALSEEARALLAGDGDLRGRVQALHVHAREVETFSARALARLGWVRVFRPLPWVGPRVEGGLLLLEGGRLGGRIAHRMAGALEGVLPPPEETPGVDAPLYLSRALREAVPALRDAQEDLPALAHTLHAARLTPLGRAYAGRLEALLLPVETALALGQVSPQGLEHALSLVSSLSLLHRWAADPTSFLTNPAALRPLLAQGQGDAAALARTLEAALTALGDIPQQRETLSLLLHLTLVVHHTLHTLEGLTSLAEAAWEHGVLSPAFAQQAGERLGATRGVLDTALREVGALRLLLEGAGDGGMGRLLARALGGGLSPLDRLEAALTSARLGVEFLWVFLGYDRPRTYLFLAQNQNEIRPTGGFIGYAARFTLDRGVVTDLVLHDSTEVDAPPYERNPQPPDFIYWYLWMERLLFRDANWNPHFPSSAAAVAEVYARWTGVSVDGVLAATKATILDVVGLFGDVSVPGHPGPLTRAVAEEYVEGQRPYTGRGRPGRSDTPCTGKRCFDEDLFFSLVERLRQGVPLPVRGALAALVGEQARRKNLLVHLFDPALAPLVWETGWNGAVRPVDHDYLMVVDNALPGHERKWASRSWEYRVHVAVDRPLEADLRLRYIHRGAPLQEVCRQADWRASTCYWNFFQVFLPRWATEIEAPPVPLHEGTERLAWGYTEGDSLRMVRHRGEGLTGLVEVGGYLTVEAGTVVTVPLRYRLAPEALRPLGEGRYLYRLLVQKQPGVDDDHYTVAVRLPEDATLLGATPSPTRVAGRWVVWRGTLTADATFEVLFRTP